MHCTFTKEPLYEDDIVVFLNMTITEVKYKFIGQIVGFTDEKVIIHQFSKADQFVTPEECMDYGVVEINPSDVVNIIISKHRDVIYK